jgi:hypothetical protein
MNTTDENVRVDDSAIDWKLVSYTVGSCWSIFFLTYLGGMTLTLFLNPLPIVLKGLAGGLIYGYVGATSGWDLETIFFYWTVLGLLLSWCIHKTKRKTLPIMIFTFVHIGLSVLALFPAMLMNGR